MKKYTLHDLTIVAGEYDHLWFFSSDWQRSINDGINKALKNHKIMKSDRVYLKVWNGNIDVYTKDWYENIILEPYDKKQDMKEFVF